MDKNLLYLSAIDPHAAGLARKYGLGLELSEFCTAWNLDDEFEETDRLVRKEMEGISRFTLHGPFNELFPCAVDRKARALAFSRYVQTIEIAAHYGIKKLIFHGGFDPHLYYPVWFQEQSILFFKDFVKEIPEGMTVTLENVLEPEPKLLTEIIQAVDNEKLRLCLDAGHAQAYSRCSPLAWVKEAGSLIDHFHIHNNDGSRDSHSPLMEGVIPMEALFEAMGQYAPKATVTLELPEAASSLIYLSEKQIIPL